MMSLHSLPAAITWMRPGLSRFVHLKLVPGRGNLKHVSFLRYFNHGDDPPAQFVDPPLLPFGLVEFVEGHRVARGLPGRSW